MEPFRENGAGGALPEQSEDQLQLGFRMIQNAFNNKVNALEQELRGLRIAHDEQKSQSQALQRKNSGLEVELVESHQRAQQLAEENKELFKTVRQLRTQIARLEDLKKKVMSSIADEQSASNDHSDTSLYMNDEYLKGAMPLTMAAAAGETPAALRPAPPAQQATPSAYGGYPDASTPAPAVSYAAPSPQAPPAAASSGAGSTPMDGKQFFRMARNNLSYEAFNEFLANIKRLNNQQQTREETLEEARRIFGAESQHLYKEFEQLLNRHAV